MGSTRILALAVEVVAFLFAAFGGFLVGVAPPDEADARFAVGIGSLLSLGILLYIAGVGRIWSPKRLRKVWLISAAALLVLAGLVSLLYWSARESLTFAFPPESPSEVYVGGTELTQTAQKYLKDHGDEKSVSQLVDDFGGLPNRELVWTRDSIRRARLMLIVDYVALVLCLAGGIFALTEGLLSDRTGRATTVNPRRTASKPKGKSSKPLSGRASRNRTP